MRSPWAETMRSRTMLFTSGAYHASEAMRSAPSRQTTYSVRKAPAWTFSVVSAATVQRR